MTVGPKGAGKAVGFRPGGGRCLNRRHGPKPEGEIVDNRTGTPAVNEAMATAKAQLKEAETRLRFTERHCSEQAVATLKQHIVMQSVGRESNWSGRAYQVERAKHEGQENLLDYALELLAAAHLSVAEAHEAVCQAIQEEIRSNHQY